MANYNFCFSPTGGTQKVSEILANALADSWQFVDLCCETAPMALSPEDLCLVCVPSYGGRVPAIALQRLCAVTANGAKAVLVCVYGNRAWEDTLTELQDTLEARGFVCAAAVAAVAEHSIFRQFAQGRPDDGDAAQLRQFCAEIRTRLAVSEPSPLRLEGSHGTYKQYGGVPFKPEGSGKCVSCGLCAKNCPVGAIRADVPRKTDKEKCISCMRCVTFCPVHARDFNPIVMKGAGAAMAPMLGGHKDNHLFL